MDKFVKPDLRTDRSHSRSPEKAHYDHSPDRFDQPGMGVKQSFRPDWLDSENHIFINKLNFVAKNYEETHKTVSFQLLISRFANSRTRSTKIKRYPSTTWTFGSGSSEKSTCFLA